MKVTILMPRPGSGGTDRVGCLHQQRRDRARLDVSVVGLDGVGDLIALAVTPGELCTGHRVRKLCISQSLAEIVKQTGSLGHRGICANLNGEQTRQTRRLDQVSQHILAVGVPIPQRPEQRRDVVSQIGDADLSRRSPPIGEAALGHRRRRRP